jgi:DNA-binding transcriptional regulator/RsmH inhibitor MraZ
VTASAQPPVFFSRFTRRFDSKRRIGIPSEWFEGANAAITHFLGWLEGERGCLRVYPNTFVEQLLRDTEASRESDAMAKQMQAQLFSRAHYLKLDPQHRIAVSADLASQLAFREEVVLLAENRSFSIWAEERFEASPYAREVPLSDLFGAVENLR